MKGLLQAVREMAGLDPERPAERWVRSVAEEAGEVTGAFNKWDDGYVHKPKTRDDVLEEIAQLLGVSFVTAHVLGVDADAMTAMVTGFLTAKTAQMRRSREASQL